MSESKEMYPSYEMRERVKDEGWKKISETACPREKACHYLNNIIWSHYWRARESLEANRKWKSLLKKVMGKKYHPGYMLDMDHYIPHYLYANRERITQKVIDAFKEEWDYKPEKSKHLPDGMTIYQDIVKDIRGIAS
jgi:hypothetical protein